MFRATEAMERKCRKLAAHNMPHVLLYLNGSGVSQSPAPPKQVSGTTLTANRNINP
jgi:hypothetical protein